MKCYAVIDTNVLVSALLAASNESATVQVLERMIMGEIIPVYSEKILCEYWEVLNRPKFSFSQQTVAWLLEHIVKFGVSVETTSKGYELPDMKDVPFYEIVMEQRVESTYLVTGNLKHFPKHTYIVTARQMLDILNELI